MEWFVFIFLNYFWIKESGFKMIHYYSPLANSGFTYFKIITINI